MKRRELHTRTGPLVLARAPQATLCPLGLLLLVCVALSQWLPSRALGQSLIKGVDEWAEATARSAAPKWGGPRVPFPNPQARPDAVGRLDSALWPLSVQVGPRVSARRAYEVLGAAEAALALLGVTGWAASVGDAGQGGTPGHDLYVTTEASRGSAAYLDAAEPFWSLDGARAFSVVDARVPESRLAACTTQALAEAFLYELDPAEAPSIRQSSAAYLSWLITGDMGCDDEELGRAQAPWLAAMGPAASGRGAEWLAQLGHRQDLNRGTFLRDMWQFARQRTWEGKGLRASPDLFEAIASALANGDEQLENVAGELADQQALAWLSTVNARSPSTKPWSELHWSKLPLNLPMTVLVEPLGSRYALVNIDQAIKPGDRLRVWSHGEFGARWTLSLLALDADRNVIGRISAPPRKNPNSFATLELMPETKQVMVSVTNVADGIPDADEGAPFEQYQVSLTVDRGDVDSPISDVQLP